MWWRGRGRGRGPVCGFVSVCAGNVVLEESSVTPWAAMWAGERIQPKTFAEHDQTEATLLWTHALGTS